MEVTWLLRKLKVHKCPFSAKEYWTSSFPFVKQYGSTVYAIQFSETATGPLVSLRSHQNEYPFKLTMVIIHTFGPFLPCKDMFLPYFTPNQLVKLPWPNVCQDRRRLVKTMSPED